MSYIKIDPADIQEGDEVRVTRHQGGEVITGVVTTVTRGGLIVRMPDGMSVSRYLDITPLVIERKTLTLADVLQMPFGTVFRFADTPDEPPYRRIVLSSETYVSPFSVGTTPSATNVPVVLIQKGPEA